MKVVDVDGAVDVARVRFQGRALSDAAGRRYRVQQIGGHHPPPIVELGDPPALQFLVPPGRLGVALKRSRPRSQDRTPPSGSHVLLGGIHSVRKRAARLERRRRNRSAGVVDGVVRALKLAFALRQRPPRGCGRPGEVLPRGGPGESGGVGSGRRGGLWRQAARRGAPTRIRRHGVHVAVAAAEPIRGSGLGDDLAGPLVDPHLLLHGIESAGAIMDLQPAPADLRVRQRPHAAATVPAVGRVVRPPDRVVVPEDLPVHCGVARPHAAIVPGVIHPERPAAGVLICWRCRATSKLLRMFESKMVRSRCGLPSCTFSAAPSGSTTTCRPHHPSARSRGSRSRATCFRVRPSARAASRASRIYFRTSA